MSDREIRSDPWADDENSSAEPTPYRRLTREEAQALVAREKGVSPWWVLTAQAAVGLVLAALAGLVTGQGAVFWSALYGAGVVVLPGALMARGMTSRLSSASPGVSAVSFMGWEFVKIGVSVALLMLAYRIVVPLSWPALLAGLVVCIKVYWVALLWRRPVKNS
jgi:ATP synthase protein I